MVSTWMEAALHEDVQLMAAVVCSSAAKLIGLSLVASKHRKKFQRVGTVSGLHLYPVKSCGSLDTNEAKVTHVGLQKDGLLDRQLAILDETHKVISMKEEPRLSLIRSTSGPETICLSAPNMEDLILSTKTDYNKQKIQMFQLHRQKIPVLECGPDANKWISKFLGRSARIIFSSPELGTRDAYTRVRKWSNAAKNGDTAIFAYLTSYLVTTTASLRNVNSQLETPVPMLNFRPNIVVDTEEPFDEDNWTEMMIGDGVLFHYVEPCRRCVITTINPDDDPRTRKDVQPLKLLKSFRCREPYGTAPLFGVYFANDSLGNIKVGDVVYALK